MGSTLPPNYSGGRATKTGPNGLKDTHVKAPKPPQFFSPAPAGAKHSGFGHSNTKGSTDGRTLPVPSGPSNKGGGSTLPPNMK